MKIQCAHNRLPACGHDPALRGPVVAISGIVCGECGEKLSQLHWMLALEKERAEERRDHARLISGIKRLLSECHHCGEWFQLRDYGTRHGLWKVCGMDHDVCKACLPEYLHEELDLDMEIQAAESVAAYLDRTGLYREKSYRPQFKYLCQVIPTLTDELKKRSR